MLDYMGSRILEFNYNIFDQLRILEVETRSSFISNSRPILNLVFLMVILTAYVLGSRFRLMTRALSTIQPEIFRRRH